MLKYFVLATAVAVIPAEVSVAGPYRCRGGNCHVSRSVSAPATTTAKKEAETPAPEAVVSSSQRVNYASARPSYRSARRNFLFRRR